MRFWLRNEEMALEEMVQRLHAVCRHTDEIMHQDITPLCAADIQDQLKKRFAYLSGGRGQDGSPVITFPDYPAFGDVPDKEFQNVMTYLTSIPRCVSLSPRALSGKEVVLRGSRPTRNPWGPERRELHVNLDARSQRPLGLGVMGIRGVRPWVRWGRGGEPPGVPAGATTCMGPAAA
uniref:MCF.2 cell line derived transforming sequence like n=1 Tax=Ursus americanus TaxID=9643 RepID=A0A452R2R5_URSAM